jgi:hypothetical protein
MRDISQRQTRQPNHRKHSHSSTSTQPDFFLHGTRGDLKVGPIYLPRFSKGGNVFGAFKSVAIQSDSGGIFFREQEFRDPTANLSF